MMNWTKYWVPLLLLMLKAPLAVADPELDHLKQLGDQCCAAMSKAFNQSDVADLLKLSYPKVLEKGGGETKMGESIKQAAQIFKNQGITWNVTSVQAPDKITEAGGKYFALIPFSIRLVAPKGRYKVSGNLLAVSEDQKKNWSMIDTSGMNQHPDWIKEWFPSGFGGLTIPPTQQPTKEN